MYKLSKFLLPFFPDNNWLRQHWWHRLVLVVSLSISLLSLAFLSLSLAGVLMQSNAIWEVEQLANSISLPEKPERELIVTTGFKAKSEEVIFRSVKKLSTWELGEKVVKIYPEYNKYESGTLGKAILYRYPSYREITYFWYGDYEVDLDFFYPSIFAVVVGMYGPNIFYRIFLYIATNDSWKRKSG